MAYDVTQKATVGQLKALALKAKEAIDSAIQDIPTEMFLDQAKTQFIPNFLFNSTTYAGAANPNLNGKPVLVLAVKGIDHNNGDAETLTYSFLDVSALVDTYTVKSTSANVLSIAGYEIELKVSKAANQALIVKNDGLHVDISAKADKVSGATNGNLAGLDANGNLTDSGVAASVIATKATKVASATANNLAALNSSGDLVDSGIAKSTVTGYATQIAAKAAKVSGATADNLAVLTAAGDLADSGIAKSTVATVAAVNAKVDKVTSATSGNLPKFGASGALADSGIAVSKLLTTDDVATDAEVEEMLTEVFGA